MAGNDAGRAYNTWPKMGDEWVPEGMWTLTPAWRNIVENTATVQFDHRMLAYTTFAAVWANYISALRGPHWSTLPKYTRRAFHATAGMSVAQVALGITALLNYVPIEVAAVHQAGSLVLLTLVTGLAHSLKFSKVGRAASVAGAAAKKVVGA